MTRSTPLPFLRHPQSTSPLSHIAHNPQKKDEDCDEGMHTHTSTQNDEGSDDEEAMANEEGSQTNSINMPLANTHVNPLRSLAT